MGTTIGCFLLLAIAAGGIYLYLKVVRLDQEIARQREAARGENEDDGS